MELQLNIFTYAGLVIDPTKPQQYINNQIRNMLSYSEQIFNVILEYFGEGNELNQIVFEEMINLRELCHLWYENYKATNISVLLFSARMFIETFYVHKLKKLYGQKSNKIAMSYYHYGISHFPLNCRKYSGVNMLEEEHEGSFVKDKEGIYMQRRAERFFVLRRNENIRKSLKEDGELSGSSYRNSVSNSKELLDKVHFTLEMMFDKGKVDYNDIHPLFLMWCVWNASIKEEKYLIENEDCSLTLYFAEMKDSNHGDDDLVMDGNELEVLKQIQAIYEKKEKSILFKFLGKNILIHWKRGLHDYVFYMDGIIKNLPKNKIRNFFSFLKTNVMFPIIVPISKFEPIKDFEKIIEKENETRIKKNKQPLEISVIKNENSIFYPLIGDLPFEDEANMNIIIDYILGKEREVLQKLKPPLHEENKIVFFDCDQNDIVFGPPTRKRRKTKGSNKKKTKNKKKPNGNDNNDGNSSDEYVPY